MDKQMKPCPFCGAPGKLLEALLIPPNRVGPLYSPACTSCSLEFINTYSRDEAVRIWNTRPNEEKAEKQIKAAWDNAKDRRSQVYEQRERAEAAEARVDFLENAMEEFARSIKRAALDSENGHEIVDLCKETVLGTFKLK